MSWLRWRWPSDITLPLLLALLRLCWLWPWIQILHRWLAPSYKPALLSPWLIVGLSLGGTATARWALTRRRSLTEARVWVSSVGIGVIILLLWWQFARAQYPLWNLRWVIQLGQTLAHWGDEVPPPFIALLAAAYLWLRGVLDGRRPLMHEDVWGAFASGFLTLALLLLLGTVDPRGLPAGTERWMLAFFAVGMTALALSSLEIARRTGRLAAQVQLRLNRYWLISVFSVILGLLGLGLLLSAILTPDIVARALSWTSIILNAIGFVLYYVLLVVSYVFFLILTPLINWLHSLLGSTESPEPMELPDFQRQLEEIQRNSGTAIPPAVAETMRWLGVIGLILVIGLAFALALRRFIGNGQEEVEETRELILSRDLLQEQLSALWQRWLQRFRRAPQAVLEPFLPLEGEPSTRRIIRALYQSLLATARERGHPRVRAQTPIEYQHMLSAKLPGSQAPLSTITREYIQARYGADPPTDEQVERVREAWERLQALLRAEQEEEPE